MLANRLAADGELRAAIRTPAVAERAAWAQLRLEHRLPVGLEVLHQAPAQRRPTQASSELQVEKDPAMPSDVRQKQS